MGLCGIQFRELIEILPKSYADMWLLPYVYFLGSQGGPRLLSVCPNLAKTLPQGSAFLSFAKPFRSVGTTTNGPPHPSNPLHKIPPNLLQMITINL